MFLSFQNIYFEYPSHLRTLAATVLLFLAASGPTLAITGSSQPSNDSGTAAADGEDDLRARLERRGVRYSAEYLGEASTVVAGGSRRSGSARHLLTLDLEVDLEPVLGIEGGTLFTQLLSVNAESGGSADSGDIQVYSNLENERALFVIYEAWVQQVLLGDRLRVKVGKVDANSEFAAIEAAGDFANSSAGFSPTIVGFPSYPDPGMSVNLFFDTDVGRSSTLTVGYGYYDGAAGVDGIGIGSRGPSTFFDDERSDDYFHIAEAGFAWERLGFLAAGRLAVGGWRHTGDFETFSGELSEGTDGHYLLAEQRLVQAGGPGVERTLDLFAQYGRADAALSEIGEHLAVGLLGRGWIPARSEDSIGLYITLADLSDDPGAGFSGNETAVEIYYRAELPNGFFLQPGLQYIVRPAGDRDTDDARIAAIRAGVSF